MTTDVLRLIDVFRGLGLVCRLVSSSRSTPGQPAADAFSKRLDGAGA